MAVVLSNLPEIIFEVAWTSTPFETAPVWVDESAYVRVNPQVSIRRGRQSELDEFSYGTLVIELANRDRRFDPTYSAGPLFGNLLPRKQCRFRLRWDSTTYDVFHGWITNLPQNYARGGTDATITIEAVDSLAMLGEMGLTLDPLKDQLNALPTDTLSYVKIRDDVWVDHNDVERATLTAWSSVPTYGPALAPGGKEKSVSIGGIGLWGAPLVGYDQVGGAVSFWLQWDGPISDRFLSPQSPGFNQLFANTDATSNSVTLNGTSTDFPVAGAGPHHYVITDADGGTNCDVYIDGRLFTRIAYNIIGRYWGGPNWIGTNGDGSASTIYIQEICSFTTALTAAQVAALYNASRNRIIEPTTTRAARILDNVGWPAAWRDLAPTTGLGAARGECADVQQSGFAHNALTVCAATEQGRYFAKKNGYVAFYGRYYAFEVTRGKTVQATFSDDGAGISYEMTGMDWSDREVNNDVTVNWSDGEKRSTDSASITALSRQSKTITTVLSTSTQAADMAAGLVQWRKDMTPRTRGIVVSGATQTAQWPTILGLEIGDRIRHEITPMAVGSQDGRDLTLEAIEWSIGGDVMHVTFYGSPIPADVFVLDSSLLDTGRLGF